MKGAKRRKAAPARRSKGVRKPRTKREPDLAAELRALEQHLRTRTETPRLNVDPEDVQRSLARLVLTLVEFLRKLMERQAIRRMEDETMTSEEIEAVGLALMRLEETIRDLAARFDLAPEDLNLDLGPIGRLM